MRVLSALPFAAGILSLLLGLASLVRRRRSPATWWFAAGMTVLGVDSLLTGIGLRSTDAVEVEGWLTRSLVAKSLVPVAWLGFSVTYSRGDWHRSLVRWGPPLAILGLLAVSISLSFPNQLLRVASIDGSGEILQIRFSELGTALNVVLLAALVLVLMNLEQTFRSAVGTMRWRIKFVVLGLAVVLGTRLYVLAQAILFSAPDMLLSDVEAIALLIGCVFLVVAYARAGFAEIEVYPSRALLQSSLTAIIVGAYLFAVGVLAQVVRRFGGADRFQLHAFVVLVGIAGLALLLLSDRLRQRIQGLVGRHFRKAQHDSTRVWAEFSRELANVKERDGVCAASARLISASFDALSVSVWLLDMQQGRLQIGGSTSPQAGALKGSLHPPAAKTVAAGLRGRHEPFDLEWVDEPWARQLRQLNPATFPNGGHRWCVPLSAGGQTLGVVILADRVQGAAYTAEDLELLRCIGDHIMSVLLNLRLASEVARARELEAFRTMSAFFVHDLKNAATSLNLMLKNLPVHFDDPAFRDDALRGLANAARRIDDMIARLGAMRQQPEFKPAAIDLNRLIEETLDSIPTMPGIELTRTLDILPPVLADAGQIRSLITNLVFNARDAIGGVGGDEAARRANGPGGHIRVRTERDDGEVVVRVQDDGCGMSAEFVGECLFRPFQSTKKNGLGVGMFQSRMIVEAHGGSIAVDSVPGEGTTVQISLPSKA